MTTALIIIGVIVLILIVFVITSYNSLVSLRNKVKDQWSQIDVLLKRRNDLIPNLVETVKGYATHEKETLNAVIAARNNAVNAKTQAEEIESANVLTDALTHLFAVAEAYPDLKANTNFMELQRELTGTEDKITYSRQFYNDSVLSYRNKIEVFPSNIVASMFGFKQSDAVFFETNEKSKEVPQVKF